MATRHSYPPIEPGQVFERLTVLYEILPHVQGRVYWWCRCICGTERPYLGQCLKYRNTKSCGCLKKERAKEVHTKHGMSSQRINGHDVRAPEYRCWSHMQQRTTNPRHKHFMHYGGRGIKMCNRWQESFQAFFEDVGPKPTLKHTIERQDNNGHYSCGKCEECLANGWAINCKWATRQEQQNNRRGNHFLTYQDQTFTVAQWARELGVPVKFFWHQLEKGLTIEEIVSHFKRPPTE